MRRNSRRCWRVIDRLAHNLRVLGVGTAKRVQRFAEVVAAMRRGGTTGIDDALFLSSRDEAKKILHNLKDLYRRWPQGCKLLLLRLSDEIGGDLSRINAADYTVEHILPHRPSAASGW